MRAQICGRDLGADLGTARDRAQTKAGVARILIKLVGSAAISIAYVI